ncbi:hypothetical protein [Streptomyces sp. CCNWLW237]|uniref:hypothetical protein n=1 Tax=Streptomyces sp. CCNWLW237 TaxID=3127465 RepID=UPI00307718CB
MPVRTPGPRLRELRPTWVQWLRHNRAAQRPPALLVPAPLDGGEAHRPLPDLGWLRTYEGEKTPGRELAEVERIHSTPSDRT